MQPLDKSVTVEVVIGVSGEEAEIVIAVLNENGYFGFLEEEDSLKAYIDEAAFDQTLLSEVLEHPFEVRFIEPKNWNEEWEKSFTPITIAEKVCIRAPFHTPSDSDFDIIIFPKMAFGTGHHQTTSLMVQAMLEEDFTGKDVGDMGTGTGILSILASLLGSSHISATEIDSWGIDNALENAELNGIKNISFYHGDVSKVSDQVFDILLANINKNVLLEELDTYAHCLKKGGSLYLSGFYKNDVPDLNQKAIQHGLIMVKELEKDNWALLIFKKQ